MLKNIFLYSVLLCLGISARAQYGGELTIGARMNYVGGGRVIAPNGERINLGYTIKGIVSPGYFILNSLAVGANLGYEYMTDDDGRQYTLDAKPFVRYYTPHGDFRFFMQLEGGYGWGKSYLKTGPDGQHHLWESSWRPGIFARVKDYMAIEVSLMSLEYKKVYIQDRNSHQRSTVEKWRYNWLDVSFGVAFLIGL